MTTVPLQFLVGITRLIAIYFGIKSVDVLGGIAMTYAMQTRFSPELAKQFPSVWEIYLPTFLMYLSLVVATWVLAPAICRLAMRSAGSQAVEESPSEALSWGEIMIFLTGILLFSWGIDRTATGLMPILLAKTRELHHELSLADQLGFFVAAALMGIGGLLAVRFPAVYAWCQKRKLDREQDLAHQSSEG
ncbi:MAG: hypothetical protein KDK97_08940 [Verrucomicrobiales bacterium]|nr:hypothetical protein [Verrucomicrobiales bacterium]MCP5557935.1 hypothetical protein [Verrucomicrobiaceae bacterium]